MPNYHNEKLCDKCSVYQPIGIKIIECIDCGKEVEVDAKANNRNRCDECAYTAKLEKYRRYNEKRKNK